MKNLKLLMGIVVLLSVTIVSAQQDPQYTQYTYNMTIINPAYAGSTGYTSLGLLARAQWIGIEGAPKTWVLSLHTPSGLATGLGFSIVNNEIGPVNEDNIYADYSYTIQLWGIGNLSFGAKAGFTFLNVIKLEGLNPIDPLLNEPINRIYPNIGAGLYYYADKFYLGFSIPNIIETRHLKKSDGVFSSASEKMHYFLTGGYVFDISYNLKLKPSVMLKGTYGAPISIDLSSNILLSNKFEIGMSYRLNDSMSALVGFQLKDRFKIGYAYDFTTSRLGAFNSGSHEIFLTFNFGRNLKSPRFF